jgi:predicted MPP superfamily phosphohydrolase
LFATLEAKDGKYSVLGNHDYDYIQQATADLRVQNLSLKDLQKKKRWVLICC